MCVHIFNQFMDFANNNKQNIEYFLLLLLLLCFFSLAYNVAWHEKRNRNRMIIEIELTGSRAVLLLKFCQYDFSPVSCLCFG